MMPALRVRFWGTRGSLPVALTANQLREKLVRVLVAASGERLDTEDKARAFVERSADLPDFHTYGGNTACIQIDDGGAEHLVCDLGSGARALGNRIIATHGAGAPQSFHVLMSHLHWDHIMGFPFFAPAYVPGNRIRIYGCHAELEEAFRRQQAPPSFPVDFSELKADIEFVRLVPGQWHEIAGLKVLPRLQVHGGDSYGYRLEKDGKSLVYTTDSEHKLDDFDTTAGFVEFLREADLVIFDAMYSLADAVSVKQDWGHSSNIIGVELCQMAGAKRLCLFHHEPVNTDERIDAVLRETRRLEEITRQGRRLEITSAYDGLEIVV